MQLQTNPANGRYPETLDVSNGGSVQSPIAASCLRNTYPEEDYMNSAILSIVNVPSLVLGFVFSVRGSNDYHNPGYVSNDPDTYVTWTNNLSDNYAGYDWFHVAKNSSWVMAKEASAYGPRVD